MTSDLLKSPNSCRNGNADLHCALKLVFNFDHKTFVIFIDTNGDNPPNVVGKDIYVLVWKEGSLLPAGNDVSTDEVNKNCSMTATGQNAGYYCAKRLMNNNWKIPKDIVF